MSRQSGTAFVSTTASGQAAATILPLIFSNGKQVISTTTTPPAVHGTKVTKLRDLANGDVGYDFRVDKIVVLHADGNEYVMRRDEVAIG